MAVYHGKTAKVTLPQLGAMSFATGWSISTSADVAESTSMVASSFFKSFVAGFDDCTITVEGNAATERATLSELSTTAGEIKVYIDATHYFLCDVFCTSVTETSSFDDIGKISYTFAMSDVDGLQYA